ncbi:hypothetical protein D1007_23440 [Hordeum vulgare]|nr:hypothetical protein D1007_23440 [Hordeum vulgare]
MDDHGNERDDAEHRRHTQAGITKVAELRQSCFKRRELEEYERELAARRLSSSGSSAVGCSSAGALSSQTITPVKRRSEELGPLAIKLEEDVVPPRGGVIGPEDYLPSGQEDHLMCAIMEHSASASKEADLRVMMAEQDKIWIDLDSDED